MPPSPLLRTARRDWVVLVLVVLTCLSAAALFTMRQAPVYQASARVFVSVGGASNAADLFQGANYTQQIVKSYADVVTSDIVLEKVINDLGLSGGVDRWAGTITASPPSDTAVLEISAATMSPQLSANFANSAASNLASVAQQLSPASEAGSQVVVTVIDRAVPQARPVSPNVALNLAAALALGLLLAVIIVLVRAGLDRRVRSDTDFEAVSGQSVIGRLPTLDTRSTSLPAEILRLNSPFAEAVRSAVVNLRFLIGRGGGLTIVVTSPRQGDGKSSVAVSLAISAASGGHRVCLIDADLRRPTVASVLGIENSVGLSDVLAKHSTMESALQRWGEDGLEVLPSGQVPPNPGDLLDSAQFESTLAVLRERFEYVIIDVPPLLAVSDAVTVSRHSDGMLLVAAMNKTLVAEVDASMREFEIAGIRLFGAVLNFMGKPQRSKYYVY